MADWYTHVSDIAERVFTAAKSGYDVLQHTISDLSASTDYSAILRTHVATAAPVSPPPSQWDLALKWIAEYKYTILAVTGITSATAVTVYVAHTKRHKKRRANRTANASRKEVLIITNFTSSAISKSIALDLERRGFIIFCACQSLNEKAAIENEEHADIRPLLMQSGDAAYFAIEKFGTYLNVPAPAYHGGHTLHFAGLILAPSPVLPCGPLEVLDKEQFVHSIDTGLCWPTTVIQYFLPLLREHSGRILFMNEWIIPTLHTPFYTPTVTTSHAIHSISKTLSREVPSLFTIHMKLGTFDLAHHHSPRNSVRADILGWNPSLRAAYSASYRNSTSRPVNSRIRGSPIKELHYAVFDALTDAKPRSEISVGAGVDLYQWIAYLLPEFLLRRLIGIGLSSSEDDWEVLDK